jgi:hypothetical protein
MEQKNITEPNARMAWEKPYLEALIDHLRPFGNVLEVGFALGYASDRIQTFNLKSHTIIEPNFKIAQEAIKWASGNPNITIIEDRWENALPKLGIFDAIFFNDFNCELASENLKSFETGDLIVKSGRDLIANVKKTFPHITTISYSDSDLEEFFKNIGEFRPNHMATFLDELLKNGQISKSQYEKTMAQYALKKSEGVMNLPSKEIDPILAFLKICLKDHMRKASRFSCFTNDPTSRFENPEFFDLIITDPHLDYQENYIDLEIPSCSYYKKKEAIIITIEKQR